MTRGERDPERARAGASRQTAVGLDDVRDLTAGLPRSYEVFVRGRTKFRVGRIVYLAFSRDETLMGFAFPKDEREAALETYPDKFLRPKPSDLRYHCSWFAWRQSTRTSSASWSSTPGAWSCRRSSLRSPTMSSDGRQWRRSRTDDPAVPGRQLLAKWVSRFTTEHGYPL